ncbi:MAG: M1 family aminopeptidase [Sphingomonas sp.]
MTHRFAPTLPLPTYLVALVTGPFATQQTMVSPTPQRPDPLPLRVIGTKDHAGEMTFAVEQSGPIVALLEKYFGQAFPYPKLDQIGSPVMPGAMENAAPTSMATASCSSASMRRRRRSRTFGMVVAHELSHQWFGDLVTPAWWDDIWLNESFANWMGYRIGNEWRPDLNIGTNAINEAFEAMNLDALVAGRPIHQHIARDGDVNAAFDQITYGKGGQVVAMIAAYMGDDTFREGVRLHMKRHTYGNASTDDFFVALRRCRQGSARARVAAKLRRPAGRAGGDAPPRRRPLRRQSGALMPFSAPRPRPSIGIVPALHPPRRDAELHAGRQARHADRRSRHRRDRAQCRRMGLLPLRPRPRRLECADRGGAEAPGGEALGR